MTRKSSKAVRFAKDVGSVCLPVLRRSYGRVACQCFARLRSVLAMLIVLAAFVALPFALPDLYSYAFVVAAVRGRGGQPGSSFCR